MELNANSEVKTGNPFPFNNLFLIKGYVTGKNDVLLYLLGMVSAFLGYVCFQFIMAIPLIASAAKQGIGMDEIKKNPNILFNPEAIGMNKSLLLSLEMGMFVFTLLFFWLAIKNFQGKTLTSVITGFDKIRWKRYFFAFLIWGGLQVVAVLVSYFINPQAVEIRFDPVNFSVLLLVTLLLIPIQTATEELIFRGYLMQGFSQLFKSGFAPLIITSVFFGLMHASNPEVKAHGLLIMMPYFILFGAFLGMLTLLDEGSELAMGVHCANNLFLSLLLCSKSSVLQTDAIFYTSVENPGEEFISWLIMALICFFILFKKYKLNNWKLLIR